jgi:NADH dehydrogenase
MPENIRKKVVVLGGGFAGLNAALKLAHMAVDVTVVDRCNHHTFQPLLYQVALAVLAPSDIALSIRSLFRRRKNVEVLLDEVAGIDLAARQVRLKSGGARTYDYLIVATGATHSYFGHDDWAAQAQGLKTVEDAIEIRRRVLLTFELAERAAVEQGEHPPLNFVIVGGGPTGVELAGAISDIARIYMKSDYRHIDPSHARVIVVEGEKEILSAYPPVLRVKATEQLTALGVEVQTGKHVTDVQPGHVMVGDEKIDSAVTLWAAGVKASPIGTVCGFACDKRGAVVVDEFMNPAGHPEIFICGDLAHFMQDGKQVPGTAQPAMQMGTHAAALIAADMAGRKRKPFRYFDKGDMAAIGRKAAVARVVWPFHANLSGAPAWAAWLLVHIYFLIGFRNRIAVFFEWAWTYFTFNRGARLITGSTVLPGWDELEKEAGKQAIGNRQ